MTIDANALAEELKVAAETWSEEAKGGLIVAAARELLATLPRFKEVEFVRYLVTTSRGDYGPFVDEKDAQGVALPHQDATIVRLTGTAKVRA